MVERVVELVVTRVYRLDDRRRRHAQPAEEGDEAEAALLETRALARRRLRAEEREAAEPAHEQRVLAHPRVQQRLRLPERARARALCRRRRQRMAAARRRGPRRPTPRSARPRRSRFAQPTASPQLHAVVVLRRRGRARRRCRASRREAGELARRVDGRRSRGGARRGRGDVEVGCQRSWLISRDRFSRPGRASFTVRAKRVNASRPPSMPRA